MEPPRNSTIPKVLICLFHAIGALQFSYSVYYDYTHVIVPKEVAPIMSAYGGKFKFLTFWNAIMQSIYFTACFLIDISNGNGSKIARVKDFIQSSLAFPVAMFVGVTFWGLYAVDRELVLPKVLDAYFPTWLNHIMHTNIMFFTLIELIITYRKYPSRSKGLLALVIFQLSYISWMHVVYYNSGFWVYNVFNVLSLLQRAAFIVVCVLVTCVFYFVGEKINTSVWGNSERQTARQRKHK